MKYSFALFLTAQLVLSSNLVDAAGRKMKKAKNNNKKPSKLPEISGLIDIAFPMWEVDEEGRRVGEEHCHVEHPHQCLWNPYYLTKRYDGEHPDKGGHPTDLDVKYAFYYGSPFLGQPFPGTPHHCNIDLPNTATNKECPKLITLTDDGPYMAGHVPPHIALAALTRSINEKKYKARDIFDYDIHECRVVPDILFKMIREYYPRIDGEAVAYPPPITPEGGDYKYEFPSGNGVDNQGPPYAPGPPHWCTEEYKATGNWDTFCPYVFKGPDAGKYRHPHIAYAALEVYLANKVMPKKCTTNWMINNPEFLAESHVSTATPFPVMSTESLDDHSIDNWLGQPVIPYNYTIAKARPAAGNYANFLVLKGAKHHEDEDEHDEEHEE